jgi:hypothetical protein
MNGQDVYQASEHAAWSVVVSNPRAIICVRLRLAHPFLNVREEALSLIVELNEIEGRNGSLINDHQSQSLDVLLI